jgi:uncharacterized repeat protein (TIGR01451 family)
MKIKPTNGLIKPLVAATAFGVVGATLAITEAGTVIKNLATVTYTDTNGDSYTATSNEAQVTVASIFTATLSSDNVGGEAAPGQTVYFPHVLTNTGNSVDTYTLIAGDDTDASATGTLAAGSHTIYLDENGNGQPDAGEEVVGSVQLEPGEQANLIVAVTIPATATEGAIVDSVLTATSSDAGADVEDITPNGSGDGQGGLDNDDGEGDTNSATNQNNVTVTFNEVIVATKSSELDLDPDNNTATDDAQITYTLTVKNTGGADADLVDIFEAIPANTTFDPSSITVAGLLTSNNDTRYDDATNVFISPADLTAANITLTTDFDEPTGIDMDGDGVTGETGISGFVVRDVVLPPNTTVSVSYTVDISAAAAGTVFKNRFCAGENLIDGGATTFDLSADVADCSNQTIDEIPFSFEIIADDNDNATAPNADDDVTYVAEAPIGGTVDFVHSVTNNGTDTDIINIEADVNTFPSGTVFTFWEANGFVPLTDNDGDGKPDVGAVASGATENFVVRAILPSTITAAENLTAVSFGDDPLTFVSGTADLVQDTAGDYFIDKDESDDQQISGADATVGNGTGDAQIDLTLASDEFEDDEVFQLLIIATSSEDTSKFDETISALGKIVSAKVDLANGQTAFTDPSTAFVPGFGDSTVDAHTEAGGPNVIIAYGNGSNADANFDEDGTVTDAAPVTGNTGTDNDGAALVGQTITIPLGFINEGLNIDSYNLSVVSSDATLEVVFKDEDGNIITSTPALSAGEIFNYVAEVTVTSDTLAGTKNLDFTVTSPTTGASDSLRDSIEVAVVCNVEVSASSLQQVQPGGNVDYVHTVLNNTNATVQFTLSTVTPPTGWSGVMYSVGGIIAGDNISGGTAIADGEVIADSTVIQVAAGGTLSFTHRVFAPANASDAQTEVLEVNVAANSGCGTTVVQDVASVIVGQIRLEKTVVVDTNCDCAETTGFAQNGASTILPGDCAIWRLEATNEGDQPATSIVINDSLTEFSALATTLVADGNTYRTDLVGHSVSVSPASPANTPVATPFKFCVGTDCLDSAPLVDAQTAANGITFADPVVTFTVSPTVNGANATNQLNGALQPGESANAQFCVQVQ